MYTQAHAVVARRRLLVAVLAVFASLAALATAVRTPAHAITRTSGVYLTNIDARLLTDINRARAAAGIAPLRAVGSLSDAAASWSTTEAAQNRIYHGAGWYGRIERSGCPTWRALAEDVGIARVPTGYTAAQAADYLFSVYRKSAEHWRNIMNPALSQVGVASVDRVVVDPSGRTSYTLFNTVEFASGCNATPQRRQTWGVRQESVTAAPAQVRGIDNFESRDLRPAAATWSRTMTTRLGWPTPTAGDDALVLRVANTSMAATGAAGFTLLQGADLRAAGSLRLKIKVQDAARAPVPITVYARQQWGGPAARNGADCALGTAVVSTATRIVTLPVPAACRYYVNIFSFRVAASSLARLGSTLPRRAATFAVYDLSVAG